jgi:hypothetical protein
MSGDEMMIDEKPARLRTHRNNISHYRRLLNTQLTDCERQFIEKRLSEERSAMERLAASTFPLTPQPIVIEMRRRVRGISERKKIKFTSGH